MAGVQKYFKNVLWKGRLELTTSIVQKHILLRKHGNRSFRWKNNNKTDKSRLSEVVVFLISVL